LITYSFSQLLCNNISYIFNCQRSQKPETKNQNSWYSVFSFV
jgi:hypothetical protein